MAPASFQLEEPVVSGVDVERELARASLQAQLFGVRAPIVLAGRYRLGRKLGSGGMGTVYVAKDTALRREIAVKLLHRRLMSGSDGERRLQAEARAMAQIESAHVVPVFDVGVTDDDRVFLAMELVDGRTLRQWWEGGEQTWREVCEAMVAAGRGLASAHAAGVVHRDFKPDNVMIDRDGRARVLDFGLAKAGVFVLDSQELPTGDTRTGSIAGTPRYMAPEVLDGGKADERSDQFSFCVTLYEGLYGQPPFRAATLRALRKAMRSPLPTRSGAPAGVSRVLRRGLSVARGARFGSMTALVDALEDAVAAAGKRRTLLLGMGAGVATVAVGGMGLAAAGGPRGGHCVEAGRELGEIWNASRKAEVKAALVASDASFATFTWARVEAMLDDYAGRWTAAHAGACETDDQAQFSCLHRVRQQLRALTDVLAEPGGVPVSEATHAVRQLPPVEACADATTVEAETRGWDKLARAGALQWAGRFDEALPILDEVLAESDDERVRADALLKRAWAFERTGAYDEAFEAAREAYFMARRLRLRDATIAAATHATDAERIRGNPQQARRWAGHTAAAIGPDGRGSVDDGWLEQKLGILDHDAGDLDSARAHFERALEIFETQLGHDHPDTGDIVGSLGAVLSDQGHYEEAVEVQRRALAIAEAAAGPGHPRAATPLGNLGRNLHALGRHEEALEHHRRALAITEATMGKDHDESSNTLNSIASIQLDMDEHEAALATFEEAIERCERAHGPEHFRCAGMRLNMGIALRNLGRLDASLATLSTALDRSIAALGAEHLQVAYARVSLGQTLAALGREEDARRELDQGRAVAHAVLPPDHPVRAQIDALTGD